MESNDGHLVGQAASDTMIEKLPYERLRTAVLVIIARGRDTKLDFGDFDSPKDRDGKGTLDRMPLAANGRILFLCIMQSIPLKF